MLTSGSMTFSTVWRSIRIEWFFVRTKSFSSGGRFAAGIPARFCLSGEFGGDIRRVAPKPLQPVIAAAFFGEDVNDEVAEVDEDPTPGRGPFHQQRLDPLLLPHLLQHVIGNRLRLTLAARRTQEEVVGDRRQLAHGEDVEIEGFLVEGCRCCRTNALLDGIRHVASLYNP